MYEPIRTKSVHAMADQAPSRRLPALAPEPKRSSRSSWPATSPPFSPSRTSSTTLASGAPRTGAELAAGAEELTRQITRLRGGLPPLQVDRRGRDPRAATCPPCTSAPTRWPAGPWSSRHPARTRRPRSWPAELDVQRMPRVLAGKGELAGAAH